MTYSTNSDQNRDNPISPSSFGITEQLLYKIAALDASVQGGFKRLDEKMDRFQTELHDQQISTNDRINDLDREFRETISFKRQRIDRLVESVQENKDTTNKRITEIETWQRVLMARAGIAFTVFMGIWTLLAPTFRTWLGVAN